MATYKEIQAATRKRYGFTAKPCWIAHVLRDNGKTGRQAWNRKDTQTQKYPCPPDKRRAMDAVLRSFKMI